MEDITKQNTGRYIKGKIETQEQKIKRISNLTNSWKDRIDYIGDIKNKHIYNCWRSFMFTIKGKKIGHSENWSNYRNFYNDVIGSYVEKYRLIRIDKSKPFSKDNFMWVDKSIASSYKNNNILLEYKGEVKSIKEWADYLKLSCNGIRLRYYRNKDYQIEEILFGKKKISKRKYISATKISYSELRAKASKMCSSYKIKDKKRRFEYNLDADWLIENILFKECVYCGDKEYIGCDRIDNSKGHTKENVLPCCAICNSTRGNNYSYEEMLLIGKTIKKIKLNRIE